MNTENMWGWSGGRNGQKESIGKKKKKYKNKEIMMVPKEYRNESQRKKKFFSTNAPMEKVLWTVKIWIRSVKDSLESSVY